MIFWWAAVAIENYSDPLRMTAKALHIPQVTVSNLLPSLTLFPLHHVEKPSTIYWVERSSGYELTPFPLSLLKIRKWIRRIFQDKTSLKELTDPLDLANQPCSSLVIDHDHLGRMKNSCCNLQIQPNMIHLTPREKFMDNTHNKTELIHLISSTLQNTRLQWSSVTMMLILQLWEWQWLLLQMALLRSVTY